MTTLTEQLITKMGLHNEANVLSKTNELIRLLELRATNIPLQINDYAKIVLCAHLAADSLGIPIDKEQALKLCGLRKSHYANNKRMFEKLLNLNRVIGVKDICMQLDLHDVTKKATEIFTLYKEKIADNNTDIDIDHPQYATMAVFFACKFIKNKVSKAKLMPFSNLRPQQFQQLEIRWEKFLQKYYKNVEKINPNLIQDEPMNDDTKKTVTKKETVVEDYEKWKARILKLATQKLKENEKENMQ